MIQFNVLFSERGTLHKTITNPSPNEVRHLTSLVKEDASLMIEVIAENNRLFCLTSNNRWYLRYSGVTRQLWVNAVLMPQNENDETLIMFIWGGQRTDYPLKETVPYEIALIAITHFVEYDALAQINDFNWHFIDELPLKTLSS